MRDIAYDASLIVLARHVMRADGAWMSPLRFVDAYADSAEDKVKLLDSLKELDLIWEANERKPWTLDNEYVWRWSNEK